MLYPKLTKAVLVLLFLFALIAGIILAKGFLMPIAFGMLLAMLLLKRSAWLESKGVPRWLSILICMLAMILVAGGAIFFIGWQVTELNEEITHVNQTITKAQQEIKQFIRETLGMSSREAEKLVQEQQSSTKEKAPQIVATVLAGLTGIITNTVLVLVYIFLFLYYRTHLKNFVLRLVPESKKSKANIIIRDSIHVSYGYLSGLAKMIACLWVMYGIGFSIVGVKHAILFAFISGTLEIIPFVGNITGTTLTVIMALVQGGGWGMVLGVVGVYALVQFVQTYFIEPLIVGSEVNLNPLFTIIGLVLGEIIWGIPGMILAIPLLGMVKIVCDNIEELKPYGYLMGQKDKTDVTKKLVQKIKRKINK